MTEARKSTQEENRRIHFFHYPSTRILSISVPPHLATEYFKREIHTASPS